MKITLATTDGDSEWNKELPEAEVHSVIIEITPNLKLTYLFDAEELIIHKEINGTVSHHLTAWEWLEPWQDSLE